MNVLADWFIGYFDNHFSLLLGQSLGDKNEIDINFIITENGWGVCYMEFLFISKKKNTKRICQNMIALFSFFKRFFGNSLTIDVYKYLCN